jgi:hypothetical protein
MQPVDGLIAGLLFGLGEVKCHQHAPVGAVDGLAVLGGGFLGERPLGRQGVEPVGRVGGDRQCPHAVLAGQRHARRRDRRCRHHRHVGLHGQQLQFGVVQFEPVALVAEAIISHPDE